MAEPLRIVELRGLAELEAIREPWQELAAAAAHDTPYVLPAFLLPWMARLLVEPHSRCEVRCLAAWNGNRLVGLAPMMQRAVRRAGLTWLSLRGFPEAAPTPPCDLLVQGNANEVVSAFLAHWLRQQDWDVLELPTVPAESPTIALLIDLAREAGLSASRTPVLETYAVPVQGSWAAFHASRSQKTRQNLRRGLRYFEQLGATRFASYPGTLDRDQALAQVDHLLARSWKDHEQGAGSWNAFLRSVMAGFDLSGQLRLSFLLLDGLAVAYLMDVPFKNTWYAIHNAYDLRYPLGNAGQLMMAHSIKQAHDEGALSYDFTGNKDYLLRWTKTTRSFEHVRIDRGGAITRLKLRLYDWHHARRANEVAAATERDKNDRKAAGRGTRGAATGDKAGRGPAG